MLMESGNIGLRDYQQEVKARLFEAWRHHRSVMVQMPTGTGKTHVLASVIRTFVSAAAESPSGGSVHVWIIAHRRELVEQIEETLARYGMARESAPVRAMSIQWLSLHWAEAGVPPSLIVIDEAHHALADSYAELWRRYPSARKLGMTATPCRMNRRGFTDLFEVLLTSWSIAEFIIRGRLSLFDYVTIAADSVEQRLIDDLEKRGADGDYQVKEMGARLNRQFCIGRLYDSVDQYARGKKGIVYAINIDHAQQIAAYYSGQGIAAVAIDSKTPRLERKRQIEAFKAGEIRVLVNVDVFSEGFDCPDVEFVQLARPTLSLAKYLQQVGRGLRRAPGKERCVLIDNAGLYRVFGLPTMAWDWESMFRGERAGKGVHVPQTGREVSVDGEPLKIPEQALRMEVVMSHDRLLAALREKEGEESVREQQPPDLKAWQDEAKGLWGLRLGPMKITEAVYSEVFDIRYNLAALRFPNKKCGLVDAAGRLLWETANCRTLKFSREYFLIIRQNGDKIAYMDLHSGRIYEDRPEIRRYGRIEILKLGQVYYSRTKKVYENSRHVARFQIVRHSFYLTIFDARVPAVRHRALPFPSGRKSGYACLLEGDYERFYWMYRRLEDGSIIVSDEEGRYYHAKEGEKSAYIGRCDSPHEENLCLTKIEELATQAKEEHRRQEARKTERRLRLLRECNEVFPFQAGMKWGLKVADRVVVPPIYRNIKPPVGAFCVVEMNYNRWGVIALDGRVVIEPNYPEVAIADDGTAVLTTVTGRSISVRL